MQHSYSMPPSMGYQHQHAPFPIPLEDNRYYYDSFRRELVMRFKLHQELQIIKHQKDVCDTKLEFYEKKFQTALDKQSISEPFTRTRRSRRTAIQIQRSYQCPHDKCSRSYGSQGSLQQHVKLKHSQEQVLLNKISAQKMHPNSNKFNQYSNHLMMNKFLNEYKHTNNHQLSRTGNGAQNLYWQNFDNKMQMGKRISDQNRNFQNFQYALMKANMPNYGQSSGQNEQKRSFEMFLKAKQSQKTDLSLNSLQKNKQFQLKSEQENQSSRQIKTQKYIPNNISK